MHDCTDISWPGGHIWRPICLIYDFLYMFRPIYVLVISCLFYSIQPNANSMTLI